MAALLPFLGAAVGTLLAVSGFTLFSVRAFDNGLWLNMAQPLGAMTVALFAGTAYQYFVEGAEKRVVKKLFGRYVSKDVYQQLISNPELAELGGKRRDMTVLFSDIRGFTAITEKGDPEELVGQLNDYFSRMVAIVFRHQGTVDKFVGDMVMALFGAPLDDPAHAEHAAATAIDMVRELGELNRKWVDEGRARLDIGIGINSGDMIAGNIGSSTIMSYTVIGDNVNLGSRLESLNKDYRYADHNQRRDSHPPQRQVRYSSARGRRGQREDTPGGNIRDRRAFSHSGANRGSKAMKTFLIGYRRCRRDEASPAPRNSARS